FPLRASKSQSTFERGADSPVCDSPDMALPTTTAMAKKMTHGTKGFRRTPTLPIRVEIDKSPGRVTRSALLFSLMSVRDVSRYGQDTANGRRCRKLSANHP